MLAGLAVEIEDIVVFFFALQQTPLKSYEAETEPIMLIWRYGEVQDKYEYNQLKTIYKLASKGKVRWQKKKKTNHRVPNIS